MNLAILLGKSNKQEKSASSNIAMLLKGAPYGNDNASKDHVTQTDSKEFKQWFKDSQVVNKDGSPRIVYHGTAQDFNTFSTTAMQDAHNSANEGGIFFATTPEMASEFASLAAKPESSGGGDFDLFAPEPGDADYVEHGNGANVMPVYLSMQNPLKLEASDVMRERHDMLTNDPSKMRAVIAQAKKDGYDGLIIKKYPEDLNGKLFVEKQYVVFDASQIKSAVGNNGKFSTKNSDITKADVNSLDRVAHQASTSPLNLIAPPSAGQAKAGNYKKGHITINGIKIAIENPAGSKRQPQYPTLTAHYGYVKGTIGADGGQIDIFVKPSTPTNWKGNVYVIDQLFENGEFDENKVMFGYDSEQEAKRAYLSNYTSDWNGFGGITEITQDQFKSSLKQDATNGLNKGAPYGNDNASKDHVAQSESKEGYTQAQRESLKQLKSETARLQKSGRIPIGVRSDVNLNGSKVPVEHVKEYLQMTSQGYPLDKSINGIVLKYGEEFKSPDEPPKIALMTPKACYENSAKMSVAMGGKLGYAEGYVYPKGLIPLQHAWNYDLKTGEVIDHTLGWSPKASYYGVKIPATELLKQLTDSRVYGALEDNNTFRPSKLALRMIKS